MFFSALISYGLHQFETFKKYIRDGCTFSIHTYHECIPELLEDPFIYWQELFDTKMIQVTIRRRPVQKAPGRFDTRTQENLINRFDDELYRAEPFINVTVLPRLQSHSSVDHISTGIRV